MQELNHAEQKRKDDGLQVIMHTAPKPVARESEIHQVWDDSRGEKELSWGGDAETPGSDCCTVQNSGRKRKISLRLALVLLSAVLLTVAVILAGYFGQKVAHHDTLPSASPAAATTISSTGKSTSGAWNGTGITAFNSGISQFWGSVIYQDYTGALKENRRTLTDTSLSTLNTRTVSVDAANTTALWASTFTSDLEVFYSHLIYVNQSGILVDVWRNNSNIDAPWTPGNLGTLSFRCPTDGRSAIGGVLESRMPDAKAGQNFTKLWAGSTDGALHQLTMDPAGWTWSPDDYVLPQSDAYGAVDGIYGLRDDGTANTTVYSTLPDGKIQLHFSIDGDSSSSPFSGSQSTWLDPVTSSLTVSTNSSIFAHSNTSCQTTKCDSILLYSGVDGKLTRSTLDLSRDDRGQVTSLTTEFPSYRVMPGSDLSATQGMGDSLVVSLVLSTCIPSKITLTSP